ncbi:MAG: CopM family metallochaperone [Janthinobacterium lividum]
MPHPLRLAAAASLMCGMLLPAAFAADTPMAGSMTMAAPHPKSDADRAMTAGMSRMRHAMSSAPTTGDADHDFVAMMTPHHAGAIDMAKVELRYGKDPELLRLAHEVVRAQEREIVQMNAWAAAHPSPVQATK